jgi:iron complex transport system ATP-binding protein
LTLRVPGRTLCTNVDLDVRAGEVWVVVGPNGSGKTTLLTTLAGLRAPAQGTVLLDGIGIATLRARDRALRIGLLPQDTFDAFPATVLETALVGRHPHRERWRGETAADVAVAKSALADVGMADVAARDVQTLSGGERRRVALAMLLAQDPGVMLLDEPTNHLDVAYEVRALDTLAQLARDRQKAVVMALHDLALAPRYATHAILMNGESIEAGPAASLLLAHKLTALYGQDVVAVAHPRGTVFLPA